MPFSDLGREGLLDDSEGLGGSEVSAKFERGEAVTATFMLDVPKRLV